MKKSTIIMIAIVYIASIVFISLFGMRAIIFEEVIPVTKVECINVSDERVTVTESNGSKVLNIPFTEPGTLDENGSPQGTFVYINVRVYPDNATNQNIIFVYNEDGFTYIVLLFVKITIPGFAPLGFLTNFTLQ